MRGDGETETISTLTKFPRNNPNPVLACDQDGALTYLNPAAKRLTKQLDSGSVERLLPDSHIDIVRTCLQTQEPTVRDAKVEGRVIAWSYHAVSPSGIVHIYGQDVTAQRMTEETLRALYDIQIAQDLTFDKKLKAVLAKGVRLFNLPIGIVSRIYDDRYEVLQSVTPDSSVKPGSVFKLGDVYCSETFAANRPFGLEHASPPQCRTHLAHNELKLRAYLGTRVMAGRDVYGTLSFSGTEPHSSFTITDMEILTLMAQWIGNEIARKCAEDALFAEKKRAEVTLHSIGDAVIATDAAGIVEYLNPVAEGLTGWSAQEARGGQLGTVFHILNEQSREPAADPVARCLTEGRAIGLANNTVLISRNGQEYGIQDTAAPIRDQRGEVLGVVLVFKDVTEARRMAREMAHQASHDALTDLVNRGEIERRLERVLETAQAEGVEHALCYLDLDRFKVINDTCGHVAGDELLRQLSGLLREQVRERDTLARLGGDEFAVLMEHCSLEQAHRVANTLCEAVEAFRFVWEDRTFTLGVSIGLAPITAATENIAAVLRAADTACYAAKDMGRNRIHVYHEDDAEFAKRRGESPWLGQITRALDENRFHLWTQPIQPVDNVKRDRERYELLLRMEDDNGRMVPPAAFLPAAERYNLATKLDYWVINAACNFLNSDLQRAERLRLCSINVSGRSLGNDEFLAFLIGKCEQRNFPTQKVCFEITETAAIANFANAARFMKTLKGRGCRFALDDFGSGLSSFAYLKNLPVDFLKIDGAFVKGIVDDPVALAMVKSINEIGHVLGKQTIAEFVESDAILEKLREINVDYVQGFGVGAPRAIQN